MSIDYLGNDFYKINLNTKDIILNIEEMEVITKRFIELSTAKDSTLQIRFERNYNTNNKILTLFNKYHNRKQTKKSTFTQIATELGISYKAVEKAYYLKPKE